MKVATSVGVVVIKLVVGENDILFFSRPTITRAIYGRGIQISAYTLAQWHSGLLQHWGILEWYFKQAGAAGCSLPGFAYWVVISQRGRLLVKVHNLVTHLVIQVIPVSK